MRGDAKTDSDFAYFQTRKPALVAIGLILLGGALIPVTLDYSPDILPALLSGLFMGAGALILWRELIAEAEAEASAVETAEAGKNSRKKKEF
jgi:hypothetical protein